MSITLKLIDDAATEVDLNGSGVTLLDGYYPEVSIDLTQKIGDSFEVVIAGTSSEINDAVREINRCFQYAEENSVGALGMWLNFAIDGGSAWRSRVYRGIITYNSKLDFYYRRGKLRATIFIERDPFWEGPETQIPLTNPNGKDNITGLNVYNSNELVGKSPYNKANYVQIAADDIVGDLSAPCRLEMVNNYNDADRLWDVFISHNVRATPESFDHWLEGEDAADGGTKTSSALASGNYYQAFTSTGDTQSRAGYWTLNSAFLGYAKSRWFKLLARFMSDPDGIRVQTKIMVPSGTPLTVVESSQEVLLTSSRLQEIGELQIPPWLMNSTALQAVDLCLYAQKTGGWTINLDYIQLCPVDSYRKLHPIGYGTSYEDRLIDDGINDQIYTDDGSGLDKTGHYIATGNRLLLVPNKVQRIYFVQTGSSGDTDISRVLSVKAHYRPRRISL